MEKKKIKEHIDTIIELVEDKKFPARRNILDYVTLIIEEFDFDFGKEIEKYVNEKLEGI